MPNPRGGPASGQGPKGQPGLPARADRRRSPIVSNVGKGRPPCCCVTSLSLCGGGPVRAGAAFCRQAAWNRKGKLRTGPGLCRHRARRPVRPARLRGFRFAGSRPKTRGSFGQSESGSTSLSTALNSERSMDVHGSQMLPIRSTSCGAAVQRRRVARFCITVDIVRDGGATSASGLLCGMATA